MSFREGRVEIIGRTMRKIILGAEFCGVGWIKLRMYGWIAELHFRFCRDRAKSEYKTRESTTV